MVESALKPLFSETSSAVLVEPALKPLFPETPGAVLVEPALKPLFPETPGAVSFRAVKKRPRTRLRVATRNRKSAK